jgi:two-component system cell cycle sensor histidine kinase/response regulator CckA
MAGGQNGTAGAAGSARAPDRDPDGGGSPPAADDAVQPLPRLWVRQTILLSAIFFLVWLLALYFDAVRGPRWLLALALATAVTCIAAIALAARGRGTRDDLFRQYKALFDGNPFPMWIYDVDDYRFLAVNDSACATYGYTRDEFLAMTILDIRPPEEHARVKAAVGGRAPAHGAIFRHRTKSGERIEAEITSQWVRWSGHRARLTLARDVTAQIKTRERLARNEEQLRLVLESTGDGIYSVDLDNVCDWCNPAAARLLGYGSVDDIIGKNTHLLFHHTRGDGTPYPAQECQTMLAAFEGRGIESDDEVLWRADGTAMHVECRSYPILRQGRPAGVVVSFIDIEEKRRAREALRVSEARFRAFTDSGIVGVAIGTYAGRMTEANAAFLDMLGYDAGDLAAGRVRWDTAIAPEYRDAALRASAMVREGQAVRPWRAAFVRKDGARVPLLVALVPQPGGALCITVDLTELQYAEQALRATEQRYRDFFERNLAGVFSVTADGRILEANTAFARLIGWDSRAALVDADAAGILPGLPGLVATLARDGALTNRELELSRIDGSPVAVLANLTFAPADAGLPERIEGCVVDLSEYKKLEQQFRQAQKMESIGQLAGGVAHDFNNLLTVITGYSQVLMNKPNLPEAARKGLGQIDRAAARAAALTRQLLAFSRQQVLEPQVLDLNTVIEGAAAMLRRVIGENYELIVRPGANLPTVKADPGQLEQVMMNLAVNARDAMPEGGKIVFETQPVSFDATYAQGHPGVPAGDYVLFAVTDTGTGMDEATRARIFEPFFTTKPVGRGTGLGLATVFGIVKQSGGAIAVYSEPGRGTSMKIYLPVFRGEAAPAVESTPAAATAGSETVLLVEDEPEVRAYLNEVLADLGYRVLVASTPGQARELSRKLAGAIDLLLSDVIMPEVSGPALAAELRQSRPEMKVLYLSGYPSQAIVASGALQSDTAFLHKPFTPGALAAKLRSVLG